VVLAHRTPRAMVPLQWTGAEPEGLNDLEWAATLGAAWEDDELVTYDLAGLRRAFEQSGNQYLEDSD
jgi:hypothetical protein